MLKWDLQQNFSTFDFTEWRDSFHHPQDITGCLQKLDNFLTKPAERLSFKPQISFFTKNENSTGVAHWAGLHDRRMRNRQKQFKCLVCPEAFSHISHLKSHVHHEHGDANEAFPFLCSICNKGFFTRWTFKQHNEQHTPGFNCHICDKTLKFTSHLLKHLETEHNVRKCRWCKQFFHNQEINQHVCILKHFESGV